MNFLFFDFNALIDIGVLSMKPLKKKNIQLYKRFLGSENFNVWYKQHSDTAILLLKNQYLKRLCECDVVYIIKGQQTVTIIDFFMRIRENAVSFN